MRAGFLSLFLTGFAFTAAAQTMDTAGARAVLFDADGYVVQVSGASHGDLGAPKPTGRSIIIQLVLDNGQFPDGAYLAQIMNDYVLAFFDKHLKSEAAPLLDGTSPYPEVLFMKKDGD